ncbi:MAG: D,D-dipeptide ABC transporter permease [Pseudonocardiales bacterium]|nr:ABC transporter permease [Actinomycetota bacterium]PZS13111.1 MAG: D,D-dipeptide ABC transporter permease [Pseudonocardiales bacterium]
MTAPRWPRRREWPLVVAAVVALLLLVVVAALVPVDPTTPDLLHRFAPSSWAHPLGTDQLGRDLAARILAGARLSVGFTLVALALCAVLGTTAGLAAGYVGGSPANMLQSVVDVLVSIPTIVFGLILAAAWQPGLPALLTAVLIAGWTPFSRLAYQLAVNEAGAGYIDSALALGAGTWWILSRHIPRNTARPLLAHACLRFANTMLTLAGLSFLGLGAQPPTPEWGAMLVDGRNYLYLAPRLALAPMTAIVTITVLVTILGRTLERRWAVDTTIP